MGSFFSFYPITLIYIVNYLLLTSFGGFHSHSMMKKDFFALWSFNTPPPTFQSQEFPQNFLLKWFEFLTFPKPRFHIKMAGVLVTPPRRRPSRDDSILSEDSSDLPFRLRESPSIFNTPTSVTSIVDLSPQSFLRGKSVKTNQIGTQLDSFPSIMEETIF